MPKRASPQIRLTGHRVRGAICPALKGTLYSPGNDSARRRGLPPSATMEAPAESGSYTMTAELPVRGSPLNYPFDRYTLELGLIMEATLANGVAQMVTSRDVVREQAVMTIEDRVARLNMSPPRSVDPATARARAIPSRFSSSTAWCGSARFTCASWPCCWWC